MSDPGPRTVLPKQSSVTAPPEAVEAIDFEDLGNRWRLTATADLEGAASGIFAEPTVYTSIHTAELGRRSGPHRFTGYSFAQFAMPVWGATDRPFDWNPAGNVHSPPAVVPLVVEASDGTVCLLAPLDAWHEQILAVVQDDTGVAEFRWGWHGDLDVIPAGTVATLGIFEAATVSEAFAAWRATIGPPDRPTDPVTTHLSYWTDNGAAYWYRTEPGLTITETLAAKLDELRELAVPVRSVELDSWFYPHEVSRPVSEVGYLDEVPPTGMLEWAPRADVLPDGVETFVDRLGRPPLILHARHISPRSPYVEHGRWWSELTAHPEDPAFFRRWMSDASRWGATCVEQDWMIMNWFGTRELRARPGRAMSWQQGLDAAAADYDLTLIWCMASPGDLMATVELDRVVAARTCDDYRYAEDPARLWRWYLTVNRLARALNLPVSKDCFFTGPEPGPSGIDGDANVEVEALLSALSSGVVGIGDRLARTDTAIIDRLCRTDGVLVGPDRPLALSDRSFFVDPGGSPTEPIWADTRSGRWRYVVAIHTADTDGPVSGTFPLEERCCIYDWRSRTARIGTELSVEVPYRGWSLHICCPLASSPEAGGPEFALIGDPTKYATMGQQRLTVDDGSPGINSTGAPEVTVRLAEGEAGVTVRTWSSADGVSDRWVPS